MTDYRQNGQRFPGNPKFGVIPNDPSKPRLRLSGFLLTPAIFPVAVEYGAVPDLGMLGNDQYGDCVFAANGHIVEEETYYGQTVEHIITTSLVLDEYSRVTGFNENDPSTDNGAMVQDGLNDLRKNGLDGYHIAAFAEISVSNMSEVKAAVYEFGAVDIGFSFPRSAMTQFNNGQPWSVVSNDGGIEGGHCVIVLGYDASYLYVATWGTIQRMTYGFWTKYVDEAWAIISHDWANAATGLTVTNVDLHALGQQYADLTGQPNPFPDVTPPPALTADQALANYARLWLKTPRTRIDLVPLAADLKAWLAAHPEL